MKWNRIKRVMNELETMGLKQILIVDPMSIYYMTEVYVEPFERFFALYLNEEGKAVLFLNKLFTIPENADAELVWITDTDDVTAAVRPYIMKDEVLGVDKDLKARFLLPLLESGAASSCKVASLAVDITRGIKDEEEQQKMRAASRINDAAMGKFKELIHDGVTEEGVASKMLQIYLDLGADGYSFSPIVSFGANAADPHHMPDQTVLKDGDCVLFDVGCIKDGYCSDMTRTFYYKSATDHQREIYETVRAANEAAEAKAAPGVELRVLDLAARDLITEKGYGKNFTHRLGHFIGLSEHEYGDVSSVNTTKARPGMIFSIEPGIYLPQDTGVRVEDLVLITESGVEILNHYPKELQIIEG